MSEPIDLDALTIALALNSNGRLTRNESADLIAELRTARNVAKDYDTNFPCDGGCNVNDGPVEECPRHGRSPKDLWEKVERGYRAEADLTRARECIEKVEDHVTRHYLDMSMGTSVLDILATYEKGSTDV